MTFNLVFRKTKSNTPPPIDSSWLDDTNGKAYLPICGVNTETHTAPPVSTRRNSYNSSKHIGKNHSHSLNTTSPINMNNNLSKCFCDIQMMSSHIDLTRKDKQNDSKGNDKHNDSKGNDKNNDSKGKDTDVYARRTKSVDSYDNQCLMKNDTTSPNYNPKKHFSSGTSFYGNVVERQILQTSKTVKAREKNDKYQQILKEQRVLLDTMTHMSVDINHRIGLVIILCTCIILGSLIGVFYHKTMVYMCYGVL